MAGDDIETAAYSLTYRNVQRVERLISPNLFSGRAHSNQQNVRAAFIDPGDDFLILIIREISILYPDNLQSWRTPLELFGDGLDDFLRATQQKNPEAFSGRTTHHSFHEVGAVYPARQGVPIQARSPDDGYAVGKT